MIIVAYSTKHDGRAYRFFPDEAPGEALKFALSKSARIFFTEPSDMVSNNTVSSWIEEREAQGDFLIAKELAK